MTETRFVERRENVLHNLLIPRVAGAGLTIGKEAPANAGVRSD